MLKPFQPGRGRALAAQGLVVLVGLALLASVFVTSEAWLHRHFLPEFFQPRDEQIQVLRIVHTVAEVLAAALLIWVRPWAGRWAVSKPARELALDLLPTLVAVALALAASEFLLHHLPWFSTHQLSTQDEPVRRRDPVMGWVYQPDRVGHGVLGGRTIEYAFDADGHRVPGPGQRVDYSAPSVVFVGESIIAGHGVTWAESIPARVGASLGLQPANLAVGGHATDQMYLRLKPEWPRYRQPRALVILFMPSLFHRNFEHDRPHLAPGLVWRPASDDPRLVQVARRLVPYRSEREKADALLMTRQALGAMAAAARARGAVPLVLVPQLTPETPEEAKIRAEVLEGLPSLVVPVDPAWHLPDNRHPDARGDARIAAAVTDYLRTDGVR